jgi:NADH-quinone oxidoreductase subunit N
MSAPVLWIIIPIVLSIIMMFLLRYGNLVRIMGITASLLLTITAFLQPIGNVLNIGSRAFDISPALNILGRSLLLENADRFALSLIYMTLLWYLIVMDRNAVPIKFVPLSLAVAAVLIAALAVEPFLYSAVLVEIAVLLIILMVREKQAQPVTGITRFLIYLTLALPSILFAGWILGGSQATATIESRLMSAVIFLMIGFSIWLAVFPFHSWLPQFSRDINPYLFSYIFSIIPLVILMTIMKYISSFLWLRTTEFLSPALRIIGVIMIVTAGLFASVEKDLKRFLAYTVLLETGFALVMLSIQSVEGVDLLYQSFIPRIFSLGLLGYSLMVLDKNGVVLSIGGIQGLLKRMPFTSIGVIISLLTVIGFPFFAGFPVRIELLNLIGQSLITPVIWMFIGSIGMLIGTVRVFVSFAFSDNEKWQINEKIAQVIVISIGTIMLLLLGSFPRVVAYVIAPFITDAPILW